MYIGLMIRGLWWSCTIYP